MSILTSSLWYYSAKLFQIYSIGYSNYGFKLAIKINKFVTLKYSYLLHKALVLN